VPEGAGPLLAGLRRLVVLLAVFAGLTAGLAVLAGLALGTPASRAVPTGLYVVACFLLAVGVLAGIRGPVRPKGGDEGRDAVGGLFGIGVFAQGIRTASADERRDAGSTSWLFLTLGFALLVLGVVVDGRIALL
jgi:hypothetical protein